ncbi:MAG: Nif3-like dinuclear metal center hexameric protein [Lachnospiraceae bacterium]|nr:Nif3-like dinuclear metal center hexameric protein [Lachnospiraceae bacterium]
MKFRELEEELMKVADLKYAEDWDNSGLQCGNRDKEIKRVFLALDCTDDVIDQAISFNADLILTHHPLIFSPLKSIDSEDYIGKRIYKLIANDIVLYAMHTNFDVCAMRDELDRRVEIVDTKPLLDLPGFPGMGIGSAGNLKNEMTLAELNERIIDRFNISNLKFFGEEDRKVSRVGILGGSGKSEIDLAVKMGCDVYISGDIDHHSGIDALEKGIAVIDAGHFGLEHVFSEYMEKYLNENLGCLLVKRERWHEPFSVIKK